MRTTLQRHWLRILVHIGASIPFVVLVVDYYTDNLTANPIQEATFRTGKTALILLVLSLCMTPLKTLFGWSRGLVLRRPLGLYAFFYATIHMLIFTAVDYGFDLELLGEAVAEKRYALVGLAAFLLLIPLAVTSTKGWIKRLGKRWKRLHQLVYVIAVLAVIHFVWLVKADITEPLLYGAAVAGLLVLRVPRIRRALLQRQARRNPPPRKPAAPKPPTQPSSTE